MIKSQINLIKNQIRKILAKSGSDDIIHAMKIRNMLEANSIDLTAEEDLDFEISFYEDVIKDSPNLVEALILLGDAYTRKGLYGKGLEMDLRLSRLRPKDPTVHYNLACDYSLLNRARLAIDTLEKAIKLGYRGFKHMETDPDLENIRKDERFIDLVRKHKNRRR